MVIYRDLVAVGHTTSPKYLVILQLEVIYDDVSLFPSNPWDPLWLILVMANKNAGKYTRWWFQRCCIFTPIPGEMIQFDGVHIFRMGW